MDFLLEQFAEQKQATEKKPEAQEEVEDEY